MSRESDRCTGCQHQAADDITACLRQDCSDSWPVQKLRAEAAHLRTRTCKWSLTPGDRSGLYTISCNGKRVLPYRIAEHPFCMFCGGRIELSPKPTT